MEVGGNTMISVEVGCGVLGKGEERVRELWLR